MLTDLVEIPYNWRKAKLGYPRDLPTVSFLQSEAVSIPSHSSVFLPWGAWDDAIEIREWLTETIGPDLGGVRLYGRFGWYRGLYETKKEFLGLSFLFENPIDYVHFKLRWQPSS